MYTNNAVLAYCIIGILKDLDCHGIIMIDEVIYVTGQILGGVAVVLGFISYQMKTQRQLIAAQVATCAIFCIHYLMIGAMSGMALNIIALIRGIFYYYRNKRQSNDIAIPIIFTAVMVTVGIFTWEAWYSIFVLLGLTINTLCMALANPQKVRASILITSPLVIIYDALALSLGGIVYESVAIVSAAIGIVRARISKSKIEAKESEAKSASANS